MGLVALVVAYLAADTYLTADQGVPSSIQARVHTFMETDNGIFSIVILLLLLIQERLLSVTSQSMCTKYCFTAMTSLPRKKSVVM